MPRSSLAKLVALCFACVLVVSTVTACGDDDSMGQGDLATVAPTTAPTETPEATEEPTSAPAPTEVVEAPEPTPTATEPEEDPENGQGAMDALVGDFPIDDSTIGDDLLSQISPTESDCVRELMGDDGFERFQTTPITVAAAIDGTYEIWGDCLVYDNLLSVAAGLVSYTGGGWETETRECATAVAMEFPHLVYYAFGLTDRIEASDTSAESQADLVRFYECLTTEEKVTFNVVMRREPVASFSGEQLLHLLSDGEEACMQESLPEETYEELVTSPDAFAYNNEEISADLQLRIVVCLTPQTLEAVPKEIIMSNLGATTEATRSCMLTFLDNNPDYIPLVVQVAENAETLSPEEFLEIANDALGLFACMSAEEIQTFIQNVLPLIVP